jgi:hypothetical protein
MYHRNNPAVTKSFIHHRYLGSPVNTIHCIGDILLTVIRCCCIHVNFKIGSIVETK